MTNKEIKEKEKRQKIAEKLKETNNFKRISQELNVCEWLVSKVAKSIGVENRLSRVKNSIPDMERLFNEGYNITDIGKKLDIKYNVVGKYLRKLGYKYSYCNKKSINSKVFEKIDTEEKAYWLGFIYADGCITRNNTFEITLQEQDLFHLQKLKIFLSYEGEIKYKSKVKAHRLMFGDTKIYNDLNKLGCTPRKSLTLKFPTESQVPINLIKHFIRGYFDGDGSIHLVHGKTSNTYNANCSILGTFDFLNKLKKVLENNEVNNVSKIRETTSRAFSLNVFSSIHKPNFLNFLYKDANIYLERKYERYKKIFYNR